MKSKTFAPLITSYIELEKMVRTMAKDGEITPLGGRKFRRYKLNEDSFLEKDCKLPCAFL